MALGVWTHNTMQIPHNSTMPSAPDILDSEMSRDTCPGPSHPPSSLTEHHLRAGQAAQSPPAAIRVSGATAPGLEKPRQEVVA